MRSVGEHIRGDVAGGVENADYVENAGRNAIEQYVLINRECAQRGAKLEALPADAGYSASRPIAS